MTLVMFNVVIAIMGDTYSRIISQVQETDGRQMNKTDSESGRNIFLEEIE